MGYYVLTVQKTTNLGILDLDAVMVAANLQTGAYSDGFEFANDGNTVLIIKDTATGDTFTLVGKADEYGRHETAATLARAIGAGKTAVIGPFPKALWDQTAGVVRGGFTTKAATTTLVAVKL